MLTIYRRHRKNCKQRMAGRDYRRCLCPIWVDGSLNGVEMRKSLRLRDWQRAQELVRRWEAEGQRIEKPKPLTVKEACDKFLVDAGARNLREPTLYRYRLLFRQFQEFATLYGHSHITDFDVDSVRRFRASWPNKNIAARKKLEAFRAFFRFVHESGWIPTNPTTPLKPPKITEPPTAPFTKEEVTSILKACNSYPDKENAVRLRALVLLLRYSGLRIRNRIQGDKLFLYTAKTGTPVYCPLPPFVGEALNAIPERTAYFFWTGNSTPKTVASVWQESLKRLLILAGVPDGHAHRFRDTFSVELLLAGVPIERVSILLGHQSVRITEKHYAPWVKARQEQLEVKAKEWCRRGNRNTGCFCSLDGLAYACGGPVTASNRILNGALMRKPPDGLGQFHRASTSINKLPWLFKVADLVNGDCNRLFLYYLRNQTYAPSRQRMFCYWRQ